jgi:hypothetical protein
MKFAIGSPWAASCGSRLANKLRVPSIRGQGKAFGGASFQAVKRIPCNCAQDRSNISVASTVS